MKTWQNYVFENTCPDIDLTDTFRCIVTNNGEYYPTKFEDKNVYQTLAFKHVLMGIMRIVSKNFIFRHKLKTSERSDTPWYIDVELEYIGYDDIKICFSGNLKLSEVQLKSELNVFDIVIHKGEKTSTFKNLEIKETSHDC